MIFHFILRLDCGNVTCRTRRQDPRFKHTEIRTGFPAHYLKVRDPWNGDFLSIDLVGMFTTSGKYSTHVQELYEIA